MKIIYITLLSLMFVCPVFAQQFQGENTDMSEMKAEFYLLKKSQNDSNKKLAEQIGKIAEITKHLQKTDGRLQEHSQILADSQVKITDVKDFANSQLNNFQQVLDVRSIVGIVTAAALLILALVSFQMIRQRMKKTTEQLAEQVRKTQESLDTESLAIDKKLLRILEQQMTAAEQLRNNAQPFQIATVPDHTLPLKVGEEMHRMKKRLDHMHEDTKGLNALKNSLTRLEEKLNESGYEINDLLGQSFVDGLTVQARFIPADNLNPGDRIITKVIRPQINYQGVLIQEAHIEVSIGE